MAQSVLACFKTGYWFCGISSSSWGRLSPNTYDTWFQTWAGLLPLSLLSRGRKQSTGAAHLFSPMSTFSISKGGWKCGFTLRMTQRRSHSVYCLLHWICQYLDGFRVCPVQPAVAIPTQNPCVVLSGQQTGGVPCWEDQRGKLTPGSWTEWGIKRKCSPEVAAKVADKQCREMVCWWGDFLLLPGGNSLPTMKGRGKKRKEPVGHGWG